MKRILGLLFVVFFVAVCFGSSFAYEAVIGPSGVLKYDKEKSYGGYTLFAPLPSKITYLIDMEGNVVHTWKADYTPGYFAMLLPNGNLLRGANYGKSPVSVGGSAGGVQEFDWDGNLVWDYKMLTETEIQHHCFDRMPNGNTLILGWEMKTIDEAIAKGRDPKSIPTSVYSRGNNHTGFWVDFVREVDKAGKTVWEWHVWDHIGTGPHQFDINYYLPKAVGTLYGDFDWTHFNTSEYIPESDHVLLNSRNFSEFYLINHKTGQMEYRWGNPSAYGQGRKPSWFDNGDQKIFGSHNASYLGKGRFLVFDNGSERPEGNRSAVMEVDMTTNEIVWEYETNMPNSFYSYRQGSCQRLPNGNTLITSTQSGHIFEVTKAKKVVWDYVSPVVGTDKTVCYFEDSPRPMGMTNTIHRSYRYGPDYPGLKGKDLSKKVPLTDCPKFYEIYDTMK